MLLFVLEKSYGFNFANFAVVLGTRQFGSDELHQGSVCVPFVSSAGQSVQEAALQGFSDVSLVVTRILRVERLQIL